MNMAGKHPARPVLRSSTVPAGVGGGGQDGLGAAWVGRIRSTVEKSEGCSMNADGELSH